MGNRNEKENREGYGIVCETEEKGTLLASNITGVHNTPVEHDNTILFLSRPRQLTVVVSVLVLSSSIVLRARWNKPLATGSLLLSTVYWQTGKLLALYWQLALALSLLTALCCTSAVTPGEVKFPNVSCFYSDSAFPLKMSLFSVNGVLFSSGPHLS